MKTNIEPGCKCLAFAPLLTHPQECIPLNFYAAGEDVRLRHNGQPGSYIAELALWIVEEELSYSEGNADAVDARYLMRIDGHEPEEQTQKQAEVVE